MRVQKSLTIEESLDLLAESAQYDVCLASCNQQTLAGSTGRGRTRDPNHPYTRWIYPATVPDKGYVHMLKVLMTNSCSNSCSYCSLSCKNQSQRRTALTPEVMAKTFMGLYRRRLVNGLFLSSGIQGGAVQTMEQMLKTAELLRFRYKYNDYLHMKIVPNVPWQYIQWAGTLADRLSINMEAPTPEHLRQIAPEKDFVSGILTPMAWTGQQVLDEKSRVKSFTTQYVVGASRESDVDIIKTMDWTYKKTALFRSYFSAYQSQDPEMPPTPLIREHRLYQSDFLLRGYGFKVEDLVFTSDGKLPIGVDPKEAYAITHPEVYPIELSGASKKSLLRIPGIGPTTADRIIALEREQQSISLEKLCSAKLLPQKALPYLSLHGKRGAPKIPKQQWLFPEEDPAYWKTGLEPLANTKKQSQKLKENNTETQANPENPTSFYPGVEGRPLTYRGRPVENSLM